MVKVFDRQTLNEDEQMFNKELVLTEAAIAAMAFCIASTLIAAAVALGLVSYSLLPPGLLGAAIGAGATFLFCVFKKGRNS